MQQNTNAELDAQRQACKTELQAALARIQQQVQQAQTLNQISQLISRRAALDEVLQTTVDLLQEVLRVGRCLIWQSISDSEPVVRHVSQAAIEKESEVRRQKSQRDCASASDLSASQSMVGESDRILNSSTEPGSLRDAYSELYRHHAAALGQGQPVVIPGLENTNLSLKIQADAKVSQVHSVLLVPILCQQSYWGGILLHQWEREQEWTGEEIGFVQSVANLCAIAVHQAQLETLRDTERWFRAVFEQTFQFTGLLTAEGIILEANQTMLDFGGFQLADVVGRPFWEVRLWTSSPATQEQLKQAISQAAVGQFVRYEVDVLGANNQVVTIDFSLKPVKDDTGQVVLLISEGRDITELKQAARQELHQQTTNILESITDAFFAVDRDWRFIYVNSQAERLMQKTRSELLGQNMWDVYPQAIGTTFDHEYHRAMAQKISIRLDEFCQPLNTWFAAKIYPAKNGLSVYFRDITDRKQTEMALRESEERFRQLAENIDAVFWVFSVDEQKTLYISPSYEKIWGRSSQPLYENSQNWMDTIYPEDRAQVVTRYERLKHGEFIEEVYRIIKPDGSVRWIHDRAFPVYDAQGKLYRRAGIAEDITSRIRTEAALKDSEQKYRHLVETSQGVIWSVNGEGRLRFVNQAVRQIYGYEPEEMIGRHFSELVTAEQAQKDRQILERILAGESVFQYEVECVRKDGTTFWVSCNAIVLRDDAGNVLGTTGTSVDITERKRAEEQLKASLQEKEVLLKEVHHRVKNNLQVISSLLDLQSLQIEDPLVRQALCESQNRVKSIALIHEQLYQSKNLAKVNLADYIHSLTTDLLQAYPINPNNITLQLKVDDIFLNLDTVIPCGLIINELVSNALKHGFPGNTKGIIWVELNSVGLASPEEKRHEFHLTVGNNGIKLEDSQNFSSAKSLGFQLVNVLVQQLNGQIEIEQSRGTEFKIRFSQLED